MIFSTPRPTRPGWHAQSFGEGRGSRDRLPRPFRPRHPAVLLQALAVLLAWLACTAHIAEAQPVRKVVIPFDFVSKFDNGRYGQMVGEMIWKKLERDGGYVIPESMLDVRDFCTRNKIELGPETPLETAKRIVTDDFGADVGIWGSVERVAGHEWDVYDLWIKCVDFSISGRPRVVYEVKTRTKAVSEIPHLYVKQMLDALAGREPGAPPPVDALAEKNWAENPNLVGGGDFEAGTAGVPSGWDNGWQAGDVNQWEPLGRAVRWIPEVGNPQNHVVRFTFDEGLGNSTGVAYYSKPFPIQEGATYRFQCRWRSNGPAVKVFIKCYAEVDTVYRDSADAPSAHRRLGPRDYMPEISELREVYRSQQNLKGPKNTWNTQTEDFTPKHTRYSPRWGRVMLYAYLGGGAVEFDDVVVKLIVPASPGDQHKEPRHSMESGVTDRQIQEDLQRSREGGEKPRP